MRAAKSVGLNIAEGASFSGKSRLRFFQIARASAVEVAAAYELAAAMGERCAATEVVILVDELYAMLTRLIQRLPKD
jgi:four helix bundle protein